MALSDAERQRSKRARDKENERQEIRGALDGLDEHVIAVALGEFDEGHEAQCLVENEQYAIDMLYVIPHGLMICDEYGYFNPVNSDIGRRILAAMMEHQRDNIQFQIQEALQDGEWMTSRYDTARRKLRYPSARCIKEVAETIDAISAIVSSKVDTCEDHEMNLHRLMLLKNGAVKVGADGCELIDRDDVRDARCMRPAERGMADWDPEAHLQNNEHTAWLAELIATHGPVLRYIWSMMVRGGDKCAGYIEAKQSNAGKSTMLSVLQEATGQLAITDRKILHSGGRFNHLEALMTRYMLVAIDEADKFETISPHLINSAINTGRIHIEQKFTNLWSAKRTANLLLVAGGEVPLDWHSQGITPDEDGHGGRFRGMVELDGVMDKRLGELLNKDEMSEMRQPVLTALLAYLTQDQQWSPRDEKEALDRLLLMVGKTYEEWQDALLNEFKSGDDEQYIESKYIKELIEGAEGKRPSERAVKSFIEGKFGASKMRLPPSKGRGMAWFGMTYIQQSETIDFDEDSDV